MKNRSGRLDGSLTVEAACVMSMVLLCLCVMIRQAGNLRDETVGAMSLHEAVEKGRHEKGLDLDGIAMEVQRYMGNPLTFPQYGIHLNLQGRHVRGKGEGSGWTHEIKGKRFRPETFLRKITLIEGPGDGNGD